MKTSTLSTLAMIGVGAVLGSTNLMAQTGQFHVNIPFQFTIGQHAMPAGGYIVRVGSGTPMVVFHMDGGKANHVALTNGIESNAKAGKASLVFQRYGNRYFLSQVWTGDVVGKELPKSAAEREEIAKVRSAEPVTLAAAVR